jgi:hypothetical protein
VHLTTTARNSEHLQHTFHRTSEHLHHTSRVVSFNQLLTVQP